MASVIILMVETDIHVFQSLEHLKSFLSLCDEDFTKEQIQALLKEQILATEQATYTWGEYDVR